MGLPAEVMIYAFLPLESLGVKHILLFNQQLWESAVKSVEFHPGVFTVVDQQVWTSNMTKLKILSVLGMCTLGF